MPWIAISEKRDATAGDFRTALTRHTMPMLCAAAATARLDKVVERLPNDWASAVGEGGTILSGGERQRVAVTQAMLKDAPIALLDEARRIAPRSAPP